MLSSDSPYQWFDDFVGVAYRYYDLRMNLVPLFHDFKKARVFWIDTIKWWNDHSIKIRFVETGDTYWFIMGANLVGPKTTDFFSKFFQNLLTMIALKKVRRVLHICDWVLIQKNSKKMSKMMQNVTAVISRRTMKKGKAMIVVFLRTVIAENLKHFK